MFCYQCEQTAGGTGCTIMGVCGKTPEAADLQDLLVYAVKGIANYAHRAGQLGFRSKEIDQFVVEALFSTVTNVNFDPQRLEDLIQQADKIILQARRLYEEACRKAGKKPELLSGPAAWRVPSSRQEMLQEAQAVSIANRLEAYGPDAAGLQELILYGLKGMAAYADHAMILGVEDSSVYAFFHEALDFLTSDQAQDVNALVAMALKVGQVNLNVMEMLDQANTGTYGHPEPTSIRISPVKGKAILVSGHDLRDLELLLKQTEGKGTH